MRMYLVSLLFIALAVASGCGYDCHAKCVEIEDDLKYRHQETGLVDVRDPCDQQELRDAATCEECEQAFRDVFREVVPQVTCDCVDTSQYANSNSALVSFYDDTCAYKSELVSPAICQEFSSSELGDWETCAEQEQS